MSDDRALYIARESDVAALRARWDAARAGTPSTVRLVAPFGGGRRAVVSELARDPGTDDALIWRVLCLDQENGLQWLIRMYGSLVATIGNDPLRRGRVEMALNSQLPSQPKRVQGWYQQFVTALKEAKTDREKGAVQLRLPTDNPLVGLVEVLVGVSRRIPLLLDLQNAQAVHSVLLAQFLEALTDEARGQSAKLMVVVHDEPKSEANEASWPVPLLDFYQRRSDALAAQPIEPWGADDVDRYLKSRGVSSDAAALATISGGRPGFTAELVDVLEERKQLGSDLAGVTLGSLVPLSVDESELEMPDSPPEEGKRKHVTPADAPQVAFFAALLGQAFPVSLVADMGGWDRESVDDLFDAMPELFEQVQFSQELGTWLYRFKRGGYREGVLQRNDAEPGHDLARRVGLFMERFLVPRGYGFVARTSRVYAEHGARGRASLLRAQALGADAAEAWGMAHDALRYFDEIQWPDPMRRVVLQNTLDRLVANGSVQAAENVYKEAEAFATRTEDRELTAWLLFAGSRLDARRADLFRARERARDAIKMYEALESPGRVAELHNHLASIELQDGNPNAALEQTNKAVEAGKVKGSEGQDGVLPAIFANAEHVRAMVSRGANKLDDAIKHFRQANEVASQAGMGALALEAGLGFGEAMLAKGETQEARDALERCSQIARQLRNGPRERNALELLAQAEGRLGHPDKALPHAARVLELSQALKLEAALPFDLYHLGFFWLLNKKPSEALVFFRRAAERIGAVPAGHPVVRELAYHKGVAHLQIGEEEEGVESLRKAVPMLQEAKDHRKVVNVLDNLATIEKRGGRIEAARKLLTQAEDIADKAGLKDERKAIRRKIEELTTPTA